MGNINFKLIVKFKKADDFAKRKAYRMVKTGWDGRLLRNLHFQERGGGGPENAITKKKKNLGEFKKYKERIARSIISNVAEKLKRFKELN